MWNKILGEMSVEDLNRRYSGTFVRYNNEIVFVQNFNHSNRKIILVSTSKEKTTTRVFDCQLLDLTRPTPRWIRGEGKTYWYFNYLHKRQWHRGFCANNCVIRNVFGGRLDFPSLSIFGILNKLYEKPVAIRTRVDELNGMLVEELCVILSPQILVATHPDSQVGVYFREKFIGYFGKVDELFIQELKELIGDYVNEANIKSVSNEPRAIKRKTLPKQVLFNELAAQFAAMQPPREAIERL